MEEVFELRSDGAFDLSSAPSPPPTMTTTTKKKQQAPKVAVNSGFLNEPKSNTYTPKPSSSSTPSSKIGEDEDEDKDEDSTPLSNNDAQHTKTKADALLAVYDYDGAIAFYDECLSALGYSSNDGSDDDDDGKENDTKTSNEYSFDVVKVLSTRVKATLLKTLNPTRQTPQKQIPTKPTLKSLSLSTAPTSNDKASVEKCVSECAICIKLLNSIKSSPSRRTALKIKTHLLKTQSRIILDQLSLARSECTLLKSSLLSSTPYAISDIVYKLDTSLKQLNKDVNAVNDGFAKYEFISNQSLSTVTETLETLDVKEIDKIVITCAITCEQSGGSHDAIAVISAIVAFNLRTVSASKKSKKTVKGEEEQVNVRTLIGELSETVAKSSHYHKILPSVGAFAVFAVLTNNLLSTIKPEEKLKLTLFSADNGVSENDAYKGAGITAAFIVSLSACASENSDVKSTKSAAYDGVIYCGGSTDIADVVSGMIGANQSESESDSVKEEEFIESDVFAGAKKGFVFKLDTQGQGYYIDTPLSPLQPSSSSSSKKKEKKRLLDPNHPAFKAMTIEQVNGLEQCLKLTPKEVESLPEEQKETVVRFREIYNENPTAFAANLQPPPASMKSDRVDGEEKKKEDLHNPLNWLKAHADSLSWFTKTHGDFDKSAFLKDEAELMKIKWTKDAEDEQKKKEEIDLQAKELLNESGGSFKQGEKLLKKLNLTKGKEKKKKKSKDKVKSKELEDLLKWSAGSS